jgi:uncharacterized coiled-coil DUF342 family protein
MALMSYKSRGLGEVSRGIDKCRVESENLSGKITGVQEEISDHMGKLSKLKNEVEELKQNQGSLEPLVKI